MTDWTGQQVGEYQIEALAGEGAVGLVYRAHKIADPSQTAAIKIMRYELAMDPEQSARFSREVRIMESLSHPHLLPLLGWGALPNTVYLIMRFVEGRMLDERIKASPLSLEETLTYLRPLATVLDYCHSQEVIHRDVKPANVHLEADSGHVYLGDFGTGKTLFQRPGDLATAQGTPIGTPAYMAPEAVLGMEIDYRADIYSLATSVYEMTLGRVPFIHKNAFHVALAHTRDEPTPPSILHADFPPVLEEVILRGLSKDREERPPSAGAFLVEFENALQTLTPEQRQRAYWGS
jgi:serine/threonine-protein kinase